MESSVTTEFPNPNYGNLEKNIDDDDRKKYEPSGLGMLLIALAVILFIALILIAFAFHRYWRTRKDQKAIPLTVTTIPKITNGTAQTSSSPMKTPPPKKPARSSLKNDQPRLSYDNVLLNVSQGNFVSQNELFTPGSRDNVSWNLPYIDASRDFLDKLDEPQPVKGDATVDDSDDKVSRTESHSGSQEKEPMLNNNEIDEDEVFDGNAESRLPRSPSEHIDLLFRMSLNGEN
ncbi:uncharacterized protein [Argopecten irradians]